MPPKRVVRQPGGGHIRRCRHRAYVAFYQADVDQSRWSFRADAVYTGVAQRLITAQEPFDVLTVYIGGTDVASHRFWRYAHPEDFFNPPPAQEVKDFGRVIDDYYIHLDRVIAALLAASPPGTSVLIVSDHGFHTVNPRGNFSVDEAPDDWNSGNHLDAPSGGSRDLAGLRRRDAGRFAVASLRAPRRCATWATCSTSADAARVEGYPAGARLRRNRDGACDRGVVAGKPPCARSRRTTTKRSRKHARRACAR
jgi:hypothetical protein